MTAGVFEMSLPYDLSIFKITAKMYGLFNLVEVFCLNYKQNMGNARKL